MQSYSKTGEFTTLGRLRSAIHNNLLYYGVYATLFTFLLFYAISKGVSLSLYVDNDNDFSKYSNKLKNPVTGFMENSVFLDILPSVKKKSYLAVYFGI